MLPGQPIHLMVGDAWANLTPEHKTFYSLGGADWIVGDEAKGPEEIVGTFNLQPILKKSEAKYSEFVGVDRRGRWLFREPGVEGSDTLLLDPTLPPVTPRLPVWEEANERGFIEQQLVHLLYNMDAARRPTIVGKADETGAPLLPSTG